MSALNELWLTSVEAGQVLSQVNGRVISSDYVRVLARRKHIQTMPLSQKMNLYYAPDCQQCVIKPYAHRKRPS